MQPVVDEKTFPIVEQDEVDDDNIENDVKDIVEAVNEEENEADKLMLICKNLLNYLSKDLQAKNVNSDDNNFEVLSEIGKEEREILTNENLSQEEIKQDNEIVNKTVSSFNIVN